MDITSKYNKVKEKEKAKVEKWETEEHKAAVYTARRHAYGIDRPANIPEARRLLEKLAEYDSVCAFTLGEIYQHKEPIDLKMAIKWYEKAAKAERCIVTAFYALGCIYASEHDDADKAVVYWLQGATGGHAGSQDKLSICYIKGYGRVEANYEQAEFWAFKAAAQHHPHSLYTAAICLLKSAAVAVIDKQEDGKKEVRKALDYIYQAAKAGQGAANFVQAVVLETGYGYEGTNTRTKEKNTVDDLVYQHYKAAAAQGDEAAMLTLSTAGRFRLPTGFDTVSAREQIAAIYGLFKVPLPARFR